MSLFTDASIEAARERIAGAWPDDSARATAEAALDAAVAALDTDTLIEKAAKAIFDACEPEVAANDEQIAAAVLTAIGLLP